MDESVFDPTYDGTMPLYNVGDESVFTTSTGGSGNSSNLLGSLVSLLSGGSGSMAQIASLGGLGALLNSLGGSGGGGYKGYQGSIPKYTASRTQYAAPTSGAPSTYRPSDAEIMDYLKRPGLNDSMIARSMNEFGISPERVATATGSPVANIQSRYNAAMGPNTTARRPGSGGVTYFSPMVYTPQAAAPAAAEAAPASNSTPVEVAAAGGLMGYAGGGGLGSLGSYSDGGRLLKGPGDGVSDSIPAMIGKNQPARLADGEFVIPARIVSEIGNGSTDAGARKLYAMMDRIQKARGKTLKNVAANTKADKHLPA
jgi:hypothetical protein